MDSRFALLLGAIQCKKEKVISFLMTSLFTRTYFAYPLPPIRFRLPSSACPLPLSPLIRVRLREAELRS